MFEILIRIESLCVDSPPAVLLGSGLLILILGSLLWLAGSHFSAVILGLLGAFVGTVVGLLVAQGFGTSTPVSMLIGALVFTIAAILFRNVLIILLATLVFALAGGTAYSSLILKKTPARSTSLFNSSYAQPFSQMDTTTRLAYASQITEEGGDFLERLRLLFEDTLQTISPYKWQIILIAFVGGLVGLLLIWSLRKLIMALCYSGVGTLVFLIGLEVALLGMNVHLISGFQQRRGILSITYLSMVVVGVIFQLVTAKSSKKKLVKEKNIPNTE